VGVQISPSAPGLLELRQGGTIWLKGGSSSAVECFLAKEEVAGSNPVFRSITDWVSGKLDNHYGFIYGGVAKWLRRGSAKPLFSGSTPLAASI
jgi:hypothetical protein